MAATLSTDMDNTDKIVKTIAGCHEMGIVILPPDINLSEKEFKVTGNSILFGLEAVKGVGSAAIESIIDARNVDGPFTSINNFFERVDQRKVNKKVVESLIKAGSFDSLGVTRSKAMELLNTSLNGSSRNLSLQLLDSRASSASLLPTRPNSRPEWNTEEMLKHEKESLGFYITGHPLTKYDKLLKRMGTKRLSELGDVPDDSEVRIGGIVTAVKKIQTKAKAEMMAYCTIEDPEGHVHVIVFPELYRNSLSLLQKDTPVLIKGTVDKTERGIKIVSTEISGLDSLEDRIGHKVEVNLTLPLSGPSRLQDLRSVILDDATGNSSLPENYSQECRDPHRDGDEDIL